MYRNGKVKITNSNTQDKNVEQENIWKDLHRCVNSDNLWMVRL